MLHATIPVRVADLLDALLQLKVAISKMEEGNHNRGDKHGKEDGKRNNIPKQSSHLDPMLFSVEIGRTLAVIEMEIMGHKLTNTIMDGKSGVNILPKETWKALGKPTLWPPTFHLVGADQHGIKPLGTLMAQKVTV